MENKIKEIIEKLMKSNEENFEDIKNGMYDDKSYAMGYAEGVHDGLLDVLKELGIETDEEYYN